MRPRLWFDHDQATTFRQMQVLFPRESTLKVRYAQPKPSKFVLLTDAKGKSLIYRAWAALCRRSA